MSHSWTSKERDHFFVYTHVVLFQEVKEECPLVPRYHSRQFFVNSSREVDFPLENMNTYSEIQDCVGIFNDSHHLRPAF